MAKFFKRIGTNTIKYRLHLIIEKVELNMTKECRMAVIFTRGDHVAQTKSAPVIQNGVAEFNEEIVVPITMYYDKKKEAFQEKEGLLELKLVTPKGNFTAGITKIELSSLINEEKGIKNLNKSLCLDIKRELPIDKCKDKHAKFFVEFRFEHTGKERDVSEDRSAPRGIKREESKSVARTKPKANQNPPSDPESEGSEGSQERGRRPPPNKQTHNSDSDDSGKRTRIIEKQIVQNGGARKHQIGTPDSDITVLPNSSIRANEQRLLEAEAKASQLARENHEFQNKITTYIEQLDQAREEYEDLKIAYDKMKKDLEALRKDKNVATTINNRGNAETKTLQDKITELEKKIEDMKSERRNLGTQLEEMNKLNKELEIKVEALELQKSDKTEIQSIENQRLQEKVNALNDRYKKSEESNRNLKNELDEKFQKIMELESKVRDMNNRMLQKESRLTDLENTNNALRLENDAYKKGKDGAKLGKDDAKWLAQIDDMKKNFQKLEEDYKDQIHDLSQKIEAKNDKDKNLKSPLVNPKQEEELAKALVENENLKKQIADLIDKNKKNNAPVHVEEFKAQIIDLQNRKDELEKELAKLKVKIGSLEAEKENLKSVIRDSEENNKTRQDRIDDLEEQIFKEKTKMGQFMNLAMELGGAEFLDALESVVTE